MVKQMKNVEKGENEVVEKVESRGLKKESREAEGMGLLQWQRKWGGSPKRFGCRMWYSRMVLLLVIRN